MKNQPEDNDSATDNSATDNSRARSASLREDLARCGVVDTHYHVGPELLPRRYHVASLAEAASPWNATIVLKNHTYATSPLASLARQLYGSRFLGSVVLNRFVGGMNPDAVRSALSGNKADPLADTADDWPIVVWMPTVHAAAHLEHFGYDFDPRWSGCCAHEHEPESDQPAPGTRIEAVRAFDEDGNPTPELLSVLAVVAECGACLATGHLSASEVVALIPLALELGVKSIIITHPHYPCIELSDLELKSLVSDERVFIEHCFAIHTIEKVPLERLVASILTTGTKQVILSTDFGQVHSDPFPDGTVAYAAALEAEFGRRVSRSELMAMFSTNGRRALNIGC